MRIGISLLNLRPGKVGGIETYIRKVVEWAPRVAGDDEVVFFVHRDNREVVPESQEVVVVDRSLRSVDIYRLLEAFTPWRARSIERQIEAASIDVMLYTQQTIFPVNCRVPSLLFVADLQYLFCPAYFSFADRQFRRCSYLRSIRRASHITTVSQFTANHVVEQCGISAGRITVIHHGFDPQEPLQEDRAVVPEEPYLYYPAASYAHKGHAVLFRSFAALKRRGELVHKLVLSGARTAYWKKLEQVIRDEGMEHEIIHLGYRSSAEVVALYRHANAVVFPSEFEGFGIPVLEAVRMEKNIICSRIPAFGELGVPENRQIDFSDPKELLRALRLDSPTQLERDPISWETAIGETFNLLRFVSDES